MTNKTIDKNQKQNVEISTNYTISLSSIFTYPRSYIQNILYIPSTNYTIYYVDPHAMDFLLKRSANFQHLLVEHIQGFLATWKPDPLEIMAGEPA